MRRTELECVRVWRDNLYNLSHSSHNIEAVKIASAEAWDTHLLLSLVDQSFYLPSRALPYHDYTDKFGQQIEIKLSALLLGHRRSKGAIVIHSIQSSLQYDLVNLLDLQDIIFKEADVIVSHLLEQDTSCSIGWENTEARLHRMQSYQSSREVFCVAKAVHNEADDFSPGSGETYEESIQC